MAKKVTKDDVTITEPSERTLAERNRFAAQLDKFATFSWRGYNMFNEFGAFIINNKGGSLKMYNGASFKNTYSQPQYQEGYSNLVGVTFSTQKISFSIGVYWISIEDYRVLMNLLHPYEVSMLSFDFEPTYGYECKLSDIKDSTRYILGREGAVQSESISNLKISNIPGGDGEGYRYYTELQLTFDVIGKQCAKEVEEYIINENSKSSASSLYLVQETDNTSYHYLTITPENKYWPSDLDFPINISMDGWHITSSQSNFHVVGEAMLTYNNMEYTYKMFDIVLKNLQPRTTTLDTDYTIVSLRYDSEQGLVYWKNGDKEQLLSLLSINEDGQRFVQYLDVNRFMWPGRLDHMEVNKSNQIKIRITDINHNIVFKPTIATSRPKIQYSARRRTNVL